MFHGYAFETRKIEAIQPILLFNILLRLQKMLCILNNFFT